MTGRIRDIDRVRDPSSLPCPPRPSTVRESQPRLYSTQVRSICECGVRNRTRKPDPTKFTRRRAGAPCGRAACAAACGLAASLGGPPSVGFTYALITDAETQP
eukprot:4833864-Prymnesium_polylepis.2